MRRKLLLSGIVLTVLLCFPLVVSVEAASMWSRTYGGEEPNGAYSLVEASDGGYAIAGTLLVKTDALGNMQWNRTYCGIAYSVVTTSDGGYVIAGTDSSYGGDCWLVKTDEFGVVPEYSSWLVPALVLTATAFIIINKKRLIRTR